MSQLNVILFGVIGVLLLATACHADPSDENVSIEHIFNMAQNVLNATTGWQKDIMEYSGDGRKSKFLPLGGGLLPFHALWGFGGLHALAVLFVLKFKVIIIASIVAFGIFYYTKFLKKCDNPLLRGGVVQPDVVDPAAYASPGYSITPYSSYIPADVSSYSSYPSVDPYSGYHDLHSDISPYDHSDHHSHDSHHYHNIGGDHDFHEPSYGLSSASLLPNTDNVNMDMAGGPGPAESKAETTHTYRRVSRHRKRRQANKPHIQFIDLGELAFRFLGVDSEGCRRRFVCELDFRAQFNPVTRLAYSFIGRNFFEKYRVNDENLPEPKRFRDCAKVHRNCKDAEKYDIKEDEPSHSDQTEVPVTNSTEEENGNTTTDVTPQNDEEQNDIASSN